MLLRRQDTPITFDLNASIYIWKRDFLIKNPSIFQKKTSIYIMSKSKSFDIDDLDDLEINKLFLKKKVLMQKKFILKFKNALNKVLKYKKCSLHEPTFDKIESKYLLNVL